MTRWPEVQDSTGTPTACRGLRQESLLARRCIAKDSGLATASWNCALCMQRTSRALLEAIVRSAIRKSAINSAQLGSCVSCSKWPLPRDLTVCTQLTGLQSAQAHLTSICLVTLPCSRGFAAQAHTAARPAYRGGQQQRKFDPSGTQGLYLMAFTIAMIGVTYASVPLYRMFCQATGYGGTVQQGSTGACSSLNSPACAWSPTLTAVTKTCTWGHWFCIQIVQCC